MEQFKFTAAPWQFLFGQIPESIEELEVPRNISSDGISWKFKEIHIGDSNERRIATVYARPDRNGVSIEEFEANAKLITACPDLLYACMDVLKCLGSANGRAFERSILQTAIDKATK